MPLTPPDAPTYYCPVCQAGGKFVNAVAVLCERCKKRNAAQQSDQQEEKDNEEQ